MITKVQRQGLSSETEQGSEITMTPFIIIIIVALHRFACGNNISHNKYVTAIYIV